MQNRGPEPPRATSLCTGLPPQCFSPGPQGRHRSDPGRAQQWAVASPTEFVSSASVVALQRTHGLGCTDRFWKTLPSQDTGSLPLMARGCAWDRGSCSPEGSLCLLCVQQALAGLGGRADRAEGVGGLGTAIACAFSARGGSDLISLHQCTGQLFLGHSLRRRTGREGCQACAVRAPCSASSGFSIPTAVCTVCWGGWRHCPWGQSVLLLPIPSPRMCMTPGSRTGAACEPQSQDLLRAKPIQINLCGAGVGPRASYAPVGSLPSDWKF